MIQTRHICTFLATAFLIVLTNACSFTQQHETTLFDELGGHEGIAELIEAVLINHAEDDRINHFFVDTDILRLQQKMFEMICEISDGPCEYTGDTMKRTHAGMGINDANFNVIVEDLIDAMESLNIPTTTQNRLLSRLAPMYRDIVAYN